MEKLFEFLTSKIGYTVAVILGFIVPGLMFVFVWNRDLYIEMDIVKLLFLSFGISFLLFIPVFIICMSLVMLAEKIVKMEITIIPVLFVPIAMNVLWMLLLMIIKVINSEYAIVDIIKEFGTPIIIVIIIFRIMDIGIVTMILKGIYSFFEKILIKLKIKK